MLHKFAGPWCKTPQDKALRPALPHLHLNSWSNGDSPGKVSTKPPCRPSHWHRGVRPPRPPPLPLPPLPLLCHRDPRRDCERLRHCVKPRLLLPVMLWEVPPGDNPWPWLHRRPHHHYWVWGVAVVGVRGLQVSEKLLVGEPKVSSGTKPEKPAWVTKMRIPIGPCGSSQLALVLTMAT